MRPVPVLASLLVAGVGVLGALFLWPRWDPDEEATLASLGLGLPLPGARVVHREGDPDRPRLLLWELAEERVRVRISEGVDAARARLLVDEETALLDSLFEDRQAPYPGELSHTLRCPTRFLPVHRVGPDGSPLVTLYANDRLAFGGCSEDLVAWAVAVAFVHCAAVDRLFRVEAFVPVVAGPAAAFARAITARCTG